MKWHSSTREQCLKQLGTNRTKGLTQGEASKRLQTYGRNELAQKKPKSLLRRFLSQFSDCMVIILLIAAAISFVLAFLQEEGDMVDSIIILVIVVINAIIGMVQESRAEKAIEALKKMSSPKAKVLRAGEEKRIDATLLVPGDLVLLEAGDWVPADLRLLETNDLQVEESALTGESAPVHKDAAAVYSEDTSMGDQKNMAFSSCTVVAGNGLGLVTQTGMQTQVGHIARMIAREEPPQTPLQKRLAKTGRFLGIGALLICLVIFILGLFQQMPPLEMFLISVSLAVAAIPEGLPAVVTIVLAAGVRRMAAKRSIIRQMAAVETLGSASVICSDKTGTLTQNHMTVTVLSGASGILPLSSSQGKSLLELACLCTNCRETSTGYLGDPTEIALAEASPRSRKELETRFPRIQEIPFSSSRKRMTTVHRLPNGRYQIITKGAPDVLFSLCSNPSPAFLRRNEEMARKALRVIGVAVKETSSLPKDPEKLETGLSFQGLIGMMDPPRKGVKEAVKLCRKAGIRPVMITGDHSATACAIAAELGILQSGDSCVTGTELDAMSQKELETKVKGISVFARVSPEHKVRIVKAFQSKGEIVAMTGDGVNDAPALRAADIGCAMGKSGTDVAKGAADMILADDNFSTIVSAIQEGRGIYDNIKKTIHFLLSCNIGEILTIFIGFLLHLPTPLLAIQLLWVNLVTDSLPALALGVEPIDPAVMERKPLQKKSGIFGGGAVYSILLEGCLIGALSLVAFTAGRLFFDPDPALPVIGRTMAFAVLSLSQIVHTFNVRSEQSAFFVSGYKGSRLIPAALLCILLQCSVILFPALSTVFKTASLTFPQWMLVAGLSLIPLAVCEGEKALARIRFRKKR